MSVIKIEKWPAVETFSMKLVHEKNDGTFLEGLGSGLGLGLC